MNQALADAIAEYEAVDRYFIRLDGLSLEQRLGESRLDAARREAGMRRIRRHEFICHGADDIAPTPQGILPTLGCAIGRCADGLARPVHSKYGPQKFVGFTIAWQTERQARVRRLGRYLLVVEGVTGSPFGQPVFAVGANTFTTEPGGVEIGAIVRAERSSPGQYCVQFRTEKDAPIAQLLEIHSKGEYTMTMSDDMLLRQVLSLEAAESFWRMTPEIREEFTTAAVLWHYINAKRQGLVTICGFNG